MLIWMKKKNNEYLPGSTYFQLNLSLPLILHRFSLQHQAVVFPRDRHSLPVQGTVFDHQHIVSASSQ